MRASVGMRVVGMEWDGMVYDNAHEFVFHFLSRSFRFLDILVCFDLLLLILYWA